MQFDVNKSFTVSNEKIFYDATSEVDKLPGLPDGMTVDNAGNLWATGPGGIYVFNPSGKLLGRLLTGERTSNCAFGEDGSTLFITADANLVRVLARQSTAPVGLVPLQIVEQGADALRAAIAALIDNGMGAAIIDGVNDKHFEVLGQVALDHPVSTGASGLGIGLARALRRQDANAAAPILPWPPQPIEGIAR